MVFSGPWFLGEIAKGVDYGLALLPTIDEAGGKPMRPWMTVEGVYIAAPVEEQGRGLRVREVPHRRRRRRRSWRSRGARPRPTRRSTTTRRSRPTRSSRPSASRSRSRSRCPTSPEMTMVWSPATTAMNTDRARSRRRRRRRMDQAQKEVVKDVAGLRKK